MVSNLALLLVAFSSDGAASMAVKGLINQRHSELLSVLADGAIAGRANKTVRRSSGKIVHAHGRRVTFLRMLCQWEEISLSPGDMVIERSKRSSKSRAA